LTTSAISNIIQRFSHNIHNPDKNNNKLPKANKLLAIRKISCKAKITVINENANKIKMDATLLNDLRYDNFVPA
jgi:hypothetical protein